MQRQRKFNPMKNLFLIAATALLVGCSQGAEKPETYVSINAESPEMIAAHKEARRTLGDFVTKIKNPPQDWSEMSLKVALPTKDNSLEHIWMSDIQTTANEYEGTVGNDPYNVEGVKFGDRVKFKYADISDWQYMKDGKLYGHYTTRALLPTLPPEQQKQMNAILGVNPK